MAAAEDKLREREKELACIYSICLLAAGGPEPEEAANGIARALCAAMQHESMAECLVSFERIGTAESVSALRGRTSLEAGKAFPVMDATLPDEESVGWRGYVRIWYPDPRLGFLSQERTLLDSVLVIAASMLRTSNLFSKLHAASSDLAAKNVALREVLYAVEAERRGMLRTFRERMAAEILPLAERARDKSLAEDRRAAYLDLLVAELERGVDSLGPGLEKNPSLSPREREIAVQVRNGRTNKEIAELLGI
ncbi:MAG TPA: hypothetical protein VLH39_03270, partial [Magnetospirillaceae bacterium]|nr:hypothetical protein [Magnetospirillaceae bacterium]